MIEIKEKSKEIETYEKVDISPIERISKAHTFKGYLDGCLQKCINDKNKELEIIFRELLKHFNKFYPNEIVKYIIKGAEQWQGVDSYKIYKGFDNDMYITEYRKDKTTGEVNQSEPIVIDKEKINYLLYLVSKLDISQHYSARYFWKKIIGHFNLDKNGVNELNFNGGGGQRASFYFPYYLYPIRVLEQVGLIKISGGKGGGLWRVK